MTQLSILVALTRDGGKSRASKALTTPLALWLGKISMNLYLVHVPVLYYVCWALHGGVNKPPATFDCGTEGSAGYDACTKKVLAYNRVCK